MFRLEAWERGRSGPLAGGGGNEVCIPVGVLGAESVEGTRFERIRMTDLLVGGEDPKSTADVARGGGVDLALGGPLVPGGPPALGEAV